MLGLESFGRCLSCKLAAALPPFPPFEEVVAGLLIPDVAAANPVGGDESLDPARDKDFLDDAHALLGGAGEGQSCSGRLRRNFVWGLHRKVLGVYFCALIDTKRVAAFLSGCKQKRKDKVGWEARIRTWIIRSRV